MNLIETYALTAGVKIDKPFIYDKYYPLPFNNYITFQPKSKYKSKDYDYWMDVIKTIKTVLDPNGIQIVQLGGSGEEKIDFCHHVQGLTTVNQAAYLIKNSLMHLGTDSFANHIAGYYKKPIVSLSSNNYARNIFPYFGDKKKTTVLEPPRKNTKPSFSAEENPKSINFITPEQIAQAVFKALGVESEIQRTREWIGNLYHIKTIESVPNQIVDISTLYIDALIIRMDLEFNIENLCGQLSRNKCSIITNQPIDIEIVRKYRSNIKEFHYLLDKDADVEFANNIRSFGIPISISSFCDGDDLKDLKFKFMEFGLILPRPNNQRPECLKDKDLSKAVLQSNRFLLSGGKIYLTKAHWLNNVPVKDFYNNISEIIDSKTLWQEKDTFSILI